MNKTIKFIAILAVCIVIVAAAALILNINPESSDNNLKKFNSLAELKTFLEKNANEDFYLGGIRTLDAFAPTTSKSATESNSAQDYSTTNIQVEGVDEPDIVKNDGEYIYKVSGEKVLIIKAYPESEMNITSIIEINNTVNNLFLNKDKLIIFYQTYGQSDAKCAENTKCINPYQYTTSVDIYDVENRKEPVLENSFSIEGYYTDARMIEDYVYLISTKNINEPVLPVYYSDGVRSSIAIGDVYYYDWPDERFVFTSVSAINVDSGNVNNKVFLTGYTGSIYVSEDNIYLTRTKYISQKTIRELTLNEVILKVLPEPEKTQAEVISESSKPESDKWQEIGQIVQDYSENLAGVIKENFDKALMEKYEILQVKITKLRESTVIHKISIDKEDINYESVGEVPGRVLNQFSMDEHDGNFRIATTTGNSWSSNGLNNLYVLDSKLKIMGSLEDLAPGESIYSVRFMEDRAYIVTFRKIDPLFVIDLKNPRSPKVLGYLKVTGYSNYLHIYDENHVIGIGKETAGGNERFSWYQGVKVSLFDVSDVENPKEVGKIEIGDRGTDSYALYDHKAFLFNKEKKLLVIPVTLAEINESRYNGTIPDFAYGEAVWQGAYVLNIDLNGISLRGRIGHDWNSSYYYNDPASVQRSLYMDDVLYTISNSQIRASDINNLQELNKVNLPYSEQPVYWAY